ncbi:Metacaspase-1A [Tolypocladium ophioglossoides CBS 100239]|uniref:Metacaspase-1A n=1 Tax=Tolypocladium ophioglossoides (strain CBS 100239) TaxID=1163406 RepID=A0A0L0N553_TOLOC|nr:Metacaspase-1A [Tolypocladium ophioglossoides CBS 100239]
MSGYPGQGQYGAADHRPGNAGFSNGGPGPGYGYGNYGAGPSGPPGPPPPGYGNYGPPGYGNYGPPQGDSPGGYNQHSPPPGLNAQGGGYAYNARAGPPPPTAPQHFGQGAPQGYTFQYSNCSGKRKALLIGINYLGQQGQLRGCINDVHNVSNFLCERYNYKREDMVILTDDQSNPVMQPTKANIIRAMEWLIKDAKPNDALFLHYSGHGGQTEDLDGDEDDGFDEVIYPVDFKQAGHIVDDEIHFRVVKPLQPGVRLTAIFDSCHSATVMDLPYIYSTKGVLKEPNLAKEAGQGLLSALGSYSRGDFGGVANAVIGFAKTAYRGEEAHNITVATRTSPADVVMWSGSKDDQTSADAMIGTQATGAMSWAFITALKQNPRQSYVELLNSIRDVLSTKYTQKPQLSCSHPLDTNLLFVM